MAITPSTNLILLKVPLSLDNKNQLTFLNKNTQFNYFFSLPQLEVKKFSYQRHNSTIRFPGHIDSLLEFNYCMYQNENYNNKWFYAFINNMSYLSDSVTLISITLDVWQTWQFDLDFKPSFIEREMLPVNEDIPGANLEPEGLETGEFKVSGTATIDELLPVYVIAYTRNPYDDGFTDERPFSQGVIINGVPSGIYYCFCSVQHLQGVLSTINKEHGDSIMTVFSIPALAIIGINRFII